MRKSNPLIVGVIVVFVSLFSKNSATDIYTFLKFKKLNNETAVTWIPPTDKTQYGRLLGRSLKGVYGRLRDRSLKGV
jgi:hypothetical protein